MTAIPFQRQKAYNLKSNYKPVFINNNAIHVQKLATRTLQKFNSNEMSGHP